MLPHKPALLSDMADYYPLIARAIAGLDPSAPGESRRALYERARAALIAQLRSVQPPLSESEITRERLSLEEAVRKVESEAAQRAREASRPGGAAPQRQRRRLPPRQCAPPAAPTLRHAPDPRPGRVRRPPPRDAPSAARRRASNRARRAICARRAAGSPAAAAGPDAGAAAADPRTIGRAAPRPRQHGAADAAAAGHARLPRHRRRRRRSRPRRGAGQPHRAKDLRQRAVALAGVRPARAEHGEPRRRSRSAVFLRRVARGGRALRAAAADAAAAAALAHRLGGGEREPKKRARSGAVFRSRARSRSASC